MEWPVVTDRSRGQPVFETAAASLDEALLVSAIDQAQNLLAARYAPMLAAGDQYGTLVRIAGVHDLAAYGRLVALLESQDAVAGVALRQGTTRSPSTCGYAAVRPIWYGDLMPAAS